MIRDVLIVSTTKMKCERIFSNIEMLYHHHSSFNSKTFFAYMMIRFHDQNANAQTKLNANLFAKDDLSTQNMKKTMKKRVNELKNVYDKIYISDDNENDIIQNATTRVFIAIR